MAELSREEFQQAFKDQAQAADRHSRDQLSAINGLAEEIRGMAGAITSQRSASTNGKVSLSNVLTIVGALAAVGVFALTNMMSDFTKHESSSGHPSLAHRVKGIEEILAGEQDRNSKIEAQVSNLEGWRLGVVESDAIQSMSIISTERVLEILWNRTLPTEPYPASEMLARLTEFQ